MSIKNYTPVTCPHCGAEFEAVLWESLNAHIDTGIKKKLLDGSLFKAVCPECSNTHLLNYPMLYNDQEHMALMYYVNSEESLKSAMDGFEGMEGPNGKITFPPDCRLRIITSQMVLREKALIFDCGLDDRVIEVIKLLYLSDAAEKYPDNEITGGFFTVIDGKYFIQFIGKPSLTAQVKQETYDGIKESMANVLNDPSLNEYVIDMNWAAALFDDDAN